MAVRKADQVYLESLLELNYSFGEQLSNLRDKTYPATCVVALIKSLSHASEILMTRLRSILEESTQNAADPEDILANASDIYDFIEYFQSYVFPILRNSDSASVPSELIRPLERLSSSIFPDCRLVISSVPETNYYFSEISPKIKEFFDNLHIENVLADEDIEAHDIFHLQLSANPACSILSHCLLGHEIGHAIYKKIMWGRGSQR